jgi:signal transduction histidine kinase/CheY-like chemotaxis protein
MVAVPSSIQRWQLALPKGLDWFIPKEIESLGPKAVQRSIVLVLLCPILFLAALVPAAAQLLSARMSPVDMLVCSVASVVFLVTPFVLRLSGSPDRAAAALIGGTLSVAAIPAYFQQGLASVLSVWFALAPMIGIYLLGAARGLSVALLGAGIYSFLFFLGSETAGLFPTEYFRAETPAFRYLNLMMALFVTSSFGVFHEFTVRRHERNREELESQVRHRQKLETTGLMAGGIAHDFNNILVSILGNASLLLEDEQDPERRSLLEPIETAALRARDLVDHMLEYAGHASAEVTSTSLNAVVEEVRVLLGPGVRGRQTVHYTLQEGLPRIAANAGQLQQVVMNLVNNALEASDGESSRVDVRTGVCELGESDLRRSLLGGRLPPGAFVFIEVEDRGAGIAREEVGTIFDPFYSTKDHGRGLGLSSVFGIVRSHSGVIQVQTELGHGATFRVLFSPVQVGPPAPSEFAPEPQPRASTGRVLVVDDEVNVRDFASLVLRRAGFEVVVAPEGATAMDMLDHAEERFDLLILDRTMPGVDGLAVLKHLEERSLGVPVILSSGHVGEEDLGMGVLSGVSAVLRKPYTPRELLEATSGVLGPGA